jgi:hypothetical protein
MRSRRRFHQSSGREMAMTTKQGFLPFALRHDMLCDMRTDEFPSTLGAWSDGILELARGDTHFGFVFSGEAHIQCASGSLMVRLSNPVYKPFSKPVVILPGNAPSARLRCSGRDAAGSNFLVDLNAAWLPVRG